MVSPDYNPIGTCATGYYGILCAECEAGYSMTGTYQCQLCPSNSQNITRITFIFIAMVIVLVLIVRSTLNGARDTKNSTSVYQKILLNHIQLISVTSSFNFNWPQKVVKFFSSTNKAGSSTAQIFSVDCFLNQSTGASLSSYAIRPFFLKVLLFSLSPLILAFVSFGFWGIHLRNVKDKEIIRVKAISTLVILLFFIHPNLVQYVFDTFKQSWSSQPLLVAQMLMATADLNKTWMYCAIKESRNFGHWLLLCHQ